MEANRSNPPDGKWPTTFRQAFCNRYHCSPEQYESRAFRRSLFLHALPFVSLLQQIDPAFFSEDYDLIREVGPMSDPELFRSEINYFYGRNLRHKSWIRSLLRMRVSGNRLIRLKKRLFPCPSQPLRGWKPTRLGATVDDSRRFFQRDRNAKARAAEPAGADSP